MNFQATTTHSPFPSRIMSGRERERERALDFSSSSRWSTESTKWSIWRTERCWRFGFKTVRKNPDKFPWRIPRQVMLLRECEQLPFFFHWYANDTTHETLCIFYFYGERSGSVVHKYLSSGLEGRISTYIYPWISYIFIYIPRGFVLRLMIVQKSRK